MTRSPVSGAPDPEPYLAFVITGQQIADQALTYLGVPYHHDGRSREGGVDCLGLAVLVLQDLGQEVQDRVGVPQHQDIWGEIVERVELHASLIDEGCHPLLWMPGDLLLFRERLMHHHAGILIMDGSLEMVHSYSSSGMVVRQPLDEPWLRRVSRVYRFNGVES